MNFKIVLANGSVSWLRFGVHYFPGYCGGRVYANFNNYAPDSWQKNVAIIETTPEKLWEDFCTAIARTCTTIFMVNHASSAATKLLFESVPKKPVKFGNYWYTATLSEPYTAATRSVLRHLIVVRTNAPFTEVKKPKLPKPTVKRPAPKKAIVKKRTVK